MAVEMGIHHRYARADDDGDDRILPLLGIVVPNGASGYGVPSLLSWFLD